jgi:uncharacterized protein YdeI (YjbR/CyaY-like superfamily)
VGMFGRKRASQREERLELTLPLELRHELVTRPGLKAAFAQLPRVEQARLAEYVLETRYPDTRASRAKEAARMLEAKLLKGGR